MSKQTISAYTVVFSVCMISGFLLGGTNIALSLDERGPAGTSPPRVDHILLNVSDMEASLTFYRDMMGLRTKSVGANFSILEAKNLGVYLSTSRWAWDKRQAKEERPGSGMYPHFEVDNVQGLVDRLQQAGYKIVQKPQRYQWGTEAFVADPDGYIWALFSRRKKE